MFHRSPAAGNRHSVRCHLLWEGSWTSGTITVPGASEYSLFNFRFSNQDDNVWCAVCAASEEGMGGRYLHPQFSGVVATNMTRVTVSAYIAMNGDVMNLLSLTSNYIQRSGDPTSAVTSTQAGVIATIQGIG